MPSESDDESNADDMENDVDDVVGDEIENDEVVI